MYSHEALELNLEANDYNDVYLLSVIPISNAVCAFAQGLKIEGLTEDGLKAANGLYCPSVQPNHAESNSKSPPRNASYDRDCVTNQNYGANDKEQGVVKEDVDPPCNR